MRLVTEKDFSEIRAWYEARHIEPVEPAFYGNVGMIEPGVAAGFLTLTDSLVAFLENFVTNPKRYAKERHDAVIKISDALEEEAQLRGYTRIIAITKSHGIGTSALGHGFKSLGSCELYGKELEYGRR